MEILLLLLILENSIIIRGWSRGSNLREGV